MLITFQPRNKNPLDILKIMTWDIFLLAFNFIDKHQRRINQVLSVHLN